MGERIDEALARVTDLRDRGIGAVESMDGFESVYGETAMEVLLEFDRELRAALDYEDILEANVKGLEAERDAALARAERAEASRDHARTEMARLGGALELALTDTERDRDAALARAAVLEAEVRDLSDAHDRTWVHLSDARGTLDEAVASIVAALTARAERAEAAARALHEEAISQAVEKVGIWNGLDAAMARAERAEAEVRLALARETGGEWAGEPEVPRG